MTKEQGWPIEQAVSIPKGGKRPAVDAGAAADNEGGTA